MRQKTWALAPEAVDEKLSYLFLAVSAFLVLPGFAQRPAGFSWINTASDKVTLNIVQYALKTDAHLSIRRVGLEDGFALVLTTTYEDQDSDRWSIYSLSLATGTASGAPKVFQTLNHPTTEGAPHFPRFLREVWERRTSTDFFSVTEVFWSLILWWALQDSNLRLPPCESTCIWLFNDLQHRGDCQSTRKSCKTAGFVGWAVG